MWEVIDFDGTIHSGGEWNMKKAFFCMHNTTAEIATNYNITTEEAEELRRKYGYSWNGDLKLIEIHEVTR